MLETVIDEVRSLVRKSGVVIPKGSKLWLSHHYGFEKFRLFGAAIYECWNRAYCKKILVLLPGQYHPKHRHLKKEETFHVLWGDLGLAVGEEFRMLEPGDFVNIDLGVYHSFSTSGGCVFEEVSTKHREGDSFYEDKDIDNRTEDRKTFIP